MARKITTMGLLTAICLVIGYIEHLIPFDFIAPGIKFGLANSVALMLITNGKYKEAFSVNICRILLSALLFSSPYTLLYSLSAGIVSFIITALLNKFKLFGIIGISVSSAVSHNLTQITIASIIIGAGVWYYLPFLIISAILGGILTGILSINLNKKFPKK